MSHLATDFCDVMTRLYRLAREHGYSEADLELVLSRPLADDIAMSARDGRMLPAVLVLPDPVPLRCAGITIRVRERR